jgi:23S rRNA pseudouridine1911/1915/1917 synthase
MKPEIVFEDREIIVCHKQPGIATQTNRVDVQDMESLLKNYRSEKGEKPYVAVIHRLDQPVEGLLVFAKTKTAAAALSKQVRQRQFTKHYYAVVSGRILPAEGSLEDYMARDAYHFCACGVEEEYPGAKFARLQYRKLASQGLRQLLDIKLETGRFHQIRFQFSSRQAPIVGDYKYGGEQTGEPLLLCAYSLEFRHPVTGQHMEFQIAPDWLNSFAPLES